MRKVETIMFAVFFSLLTAAPGAQAEKRVALVIGNSAYRHTPQLANPTNDAADMAAVLKSLGFQVHEGLDLDKAAFERKIRDFATALQGADAGVFFYAGHGLQVSGQNYLVPIDAELENAAALDLEMVRLDIVQRVMERQTTTNILFLDACRNNPLARNLARSMGTRSGEIGHGLAPVESGIGTLIGFSTQPGNVALDGTGRNSPFAGALVKHLALATPKDDVNSILINVRNDVLRETQNKQVPWEHSALRGRFHFNPAAPTPSVAVTSPPNPALSAAAEAWDRTNKRSISALEAFVRRFGDTYYGDLAKVQLSDLKKQDMAAATAPPPPAKPTPRSVGDVFRDCPTCPEMVVVPAGSFMMGSPESEPGRKSNEDQHNVTIGAPFAVGRFAVTRGEFAAFVVDTGRQTVGGCFSYAGGGEWREQVDRDWRSPGFSQNDRHPAVCVSWNDAKAYAAWLKRKTGKEYRLPSETEREYVARAGTTTPFWWGSSVSTNQANYDGRAAPYEGGGSKGEWRRATVPVDTFEPNPWGLYNVHGNVWDWTEDCRNDSNAGNPGDGKARTNDTCVSRVLRGGSWISVPGSLRSAFRYTYNRDLRDSYIGFRLARTLSP